MRGWLLILAGMLASGAFADEHETRNPLSEWSGLWGPDPELSSAALARDGWQFLAMSGLSWPDGRQAVVTMWRSQLGDFARCLDYFDESMQQTGGGCSHSGTGL